MADWNPALYTRFEDERTRPAAELLARVPLDAPSLAYDLGCGPGNSTALIAARFPGAEVVGLDTSPAMLESARARLPDLAFAQADAATWTPDRAPDLIYANAVLQWLLDHATLLPRLFGLLAPGGVLAVQMPDNLAEPTHRLMRAVAPGRRRSGTRRWPVASAGCWSRRPITTSWRRAPPRSMSGAPPITTGWRMPPPSWTG
jgi:trans-aconitate 2-methyltransferase